MIETQLSFIHPCPSGNTVDPCRQVPCICTVAAPLVVSHSKCSYRDLRQMFIDLKFYGGPSLGFLQFIYQNGIHFNILIFTAGFTGWCDDYAYVIQLGGNCDVTTLYVYSDENTLQTA